MPGYHGIDRIIPALAGNTITQDSGFQLVQDHPRSRGEYPYDRGILAALRGSSPLSRGIHPGRPKGSDGGRIIPALAGNTFFRYL